MFLGQLHLFFKAFDRFFDNPVKTDPQCWAKNALSRTLFALEYQEAEVFLRGMRHIQMEPVWGGQSDTAGTLRSTCALALVQCRGLNDRDLLTHLLELLGDNIDGLTFPEISEQLGLAKSSLHALLMTLVLWGVSLRSGS